MVPHMEFLFTLGTPNQARKTGQSLTLANCHSDQSVTGQSVSGQSVTGQSVILAKVSRPKCDSALNRHIVHEDLMKVHSNLAIRNLGCPKIVP